ncbi:MAG TPA: hypothetical protein VFT72_20565 [Opitutaceae bacterium]|nr:hypothetical protein [Opitutaceae bacterium]
MRDSEIKEHLIALLGGIKNPDAASVAAAMEKLDEILAAHRAELHPQLAHFLERRSYAKALDFLGGVDVPSGKCAPKGSRSP